MKKIEHIGIAVKNMEAATAMYSVLLNTKPYKNEVVDSEGVCTTFFRMGESKIELLAATNDESPIAKFLEKRGEGIHHIAFDVTDIDAEISRLQAEGFELINKTSKHGADNKMIAFLHPKCTGGVLVELCMEVR